MFIRDNDSLSQFCSAARGAGLFALDTEFVREKTYSPRLCLVQVATAGEAGAIDPFGPVDLAPLLELVCDPAVETVVHAGRQDFEIFCARTARVPRTVFDTQIAAALAGLGEEIGLANLLERTLGVTLSKVETVTDWTQRPLTQAQIDYAIEDVRHLLRLREHLRGILGGLGRLEWLREESAWYEEKGSYERDPRAQCLRYRGARSLSRQGLAVLQELAEWREAEAARRDVPRNRVVSEETLVEVARRSPRSAADLRAVRGLHPGEIERGAAAILSAVERGKKTPEDRLPTLAPSRSDDPDRALLVDFLEVLLRERAREAQIAAGYLATRTQLSALVDAHLEGREAVDPESGEAIAILQGWRRMLAGEELRRALQGEVALGIDPRTRSLRIRQE